MSKVRDLTGKTFGKLTVIEKHDRINNHWNWLCKCECGNEKVIRGSSLTCNDRSTKSCGCIRVDNLTTNGLSSTRVATSYYQMIGRCGNKKSKSYSDYGGRGIRVCDEWQGNDGLSNFYYWSIANGFEEGLSIDRIDSNGNYEPSNCRWADRLTQNNNKRNNIFIEYNNKSQTITQWARELGINSAKVWARLNKLNWSVERAFETP